MNMFVVAFGLRMTDVTNMVLRRISAGEQNPRAFDLEGDRDRIAGADRIFHGRGTFQLFLASGYTPCR